MNEIVQDKKKILKRKKDRWNEGMMEIKAEDDENQNPLPSNHCESAVKGNRISSIDYDKQPAINCNMRWVFPGQLSDSVQYRHCSLFLEMTRY